MPENPATWCRRMTELTGDYHYYQLTEMWSKNMFDVVFDRVIGHEGGFQKDPKDRGNWTSGKCGVGELKGTKFGLAAMTYPHLDIEKITQAQAKAIYFEEWWVALKMDAYPSALAYQMFDASINHGSGRAIQFVQRAVGVKDDGILGPKTMKTINAMDINDVLMLFIAERLQYFTEVKTWDTYGKGWARRMVQNLRYGAQDNGV